jgi:hypothetical protein
MEGELTVALRPVEREIDLGSNEGRTRSIQVWHWPRYWYRSSVDRPAVDRHTQRSSFLLWNDAWSSRPRRTVVEVDHLVGFQRCHMFAHVLHVCGR